MAKDPVLPECVVVLSPAARRMEDGLMGFHCRGPSMLPTLRTGDLLVVAPYNSLPVRRGDIVVFRIPGSDRLIAHRVAAIRNTVVRVRGDNNNLTDPWPLDVKDLLGRVIRRERNRSVRRLTGGAGGDLYARAVRVLSAARRALFRLFRPAYLWASEKGLVRRLLPFRLKTRVLAVKRPQGTELQLLAGRRLIARRPARTGTWLVRRPYKLLIDARSLPENTEASARRPSSQKNDIMPR